ncbi:MAG: nitrous oxide reductase accessory protein NosL [Acidimicrobiia bacterium]|nr:nitrous oxide reductase accessory protein NosL [Acidimicrobiia bacterium]
MRRWLVLVLTLVLLSVACGADPPRTGPPEIAYGRDLCTECRMIIEDPRFAAAYRTPDGEERRFDDIGGLVLYGVETGELDSAEVWVHDHDTEAWIPADRATFVVADRFPTPMGHGAVAFADRGRATAFAGSVDGVVVEWTALAAWSFDDHVHADHP